MLSEGEGERSVQMLMDGDGAPCQRTAPLHFLDLQAKVVELHSVIAVHYSLMLQGEDALQVLSRQGHEGASGFCCRHLELTVEHLHIVFTEKAIGLFHARDAMQS